MKLKKSKYLNYFIAGFLSTIFTAPVYAQNPPAGECYVKGVSSGNRSMTAYHTFRQTPVNGSGGSSDLSIYDFVCGSGASIRLNPDSMLQAMPPLWRSHLNFLNGNDWWGSDWLKPTWYIGIALWKTGATGASKVVRNEMRGREPGSDIDPAPYTYQVRGTENISIRVQTVGFLQHNRQFPALNLSGVAARVGSNTIYYDHRYVTVVDPCADVWKVKVQPERINLGSQNRQNFSPRSAAFKVEALKTYNPGCGGATATPKVTFVPDGNHNGTNIMYLDNGSEILLEDLAGRPVQFNTSADMGKTIGGGENWHLDQRVLRDYKLTWRKTPGKNLSVGSFTRNLKIQMEFR